MHATDTKMGDGGQKASRSAYGFCYARFPSTVECEVLTTINFQQLGFAPSCQFWAIAGDILPFFHRPARWRPMHTLFSAR